VASLYPPLLPVDGRQTQDAGAKAPGWEAFVEAIRASRERNMPDWNDTIRARLKNLNLEGAREGGIVQELADHLDDRYRELSESGE
jgi:hypothetical protein